MHIPVLLKEVIEYLDPKPNENFVDATIASGGHATEILRKIVPSGKLLGIDWNNEAIMKLKTKFQSEIQAGVLILETANFAAIASILKKVKFPRPDGIIADLGMSSEELEESGRGFSFQKDEPLLMTYDANPPAGALSAEKIINTFSEKELIEIFRKFGEERFARRYASAIIAARKLSPIHTSRELAAIIESVAPLRTAVSRLYGAPRRRARIHPATRIFQALRIAVNQELDNLSALIENGFSALNPGGRMLIISYHSLEDRIVKQAFRKRAAEGAGKMLVKKPVRPTAQEVSQNPRSRSAKLRAIQKL